MANRLTMPNAEAIICDAGDDVWHEGEVFNTELRSVGERPAYSLSNSDVQTIAPAQHTGTVQLAKGRTNTMTRVNFTLTGVIRTKDGHFKKVGIQFIQI